MAITIPFHQAWQNKATAASYSVSSTTLPQLNDYVIIIASYQASGNASIGSDTTGGAFTVLQTQTTTGVSSTMFGRKITTTPSGSSYSATVSMPSNQAQTYHMVYLRGSNIVASNGGSFPENSTTSFSQSISRGSTSTMSLYMSSMNGAGFPTDGSGGTLIDGIATSGKGGATNVGSTVAYMPVSASSYTISFSGLSGNYGTMMYREFYENDTTPPGNVTNLSSSIQDTAITLSWTNPTDTDFSYAKVYRGATLVGNNVTNGTYTDTGLAVSTSYTYKVTTVDTFGNESAGVTATYTTTNVNPPAEVSNLSGTATDTEINLSWAMPSDADFSYVNVYRNGTLIASNVVDAFYTDSGLNTAASYTYKVTTVDTIGNESPGSTLTISTTNTLPPAEVTSLTEVHTYTSVRLDWINPTDIDFISVKVYKNGNLIKKLSSTVNNYSESGLSPAINYVYKVSTVDNAGNESSGVSINVLTNAQPTQTSPPPAGTETTPIVTVGTIQHSKISNQTGINSSSVTFTFNTDVTSWEVRVMGAGQGTGTLADSGGAVAAGTNITAVIDWNELYQEGANRVNIYGQNANGWTPYNDNGEGGSITVYIYGSQILGNVIYGMG